MAVDLSWAARADLVGSPSQPNAFETLHGLQTPSEASVASIADIIAACKALDKGGRNFGDPEERDATRRAIAGLDEWLENSVQANVLARSTVAENVVGQGNAPVPAISGHLTDPAAARSAAFERAEQAAATFKDATGSLATSKCGAHINNATIS